jgi:hypothetical protein
MFGNTKEPEAAAPVPPLHYEHCREDVQYNSHDKNGLPVVDAAEAAGVSVWKALAASDLRYAEKINLANWWASKGRGPQADREEFFA